MMEISKVIEKHLRMILVTFTGVIYVFLLILASRQWYFFDEWDLIGPRYQLFLDGNWPQFLFSPLVDHLTALNVVVYALVVKLFGIESYLLVGFLMVTSHLAVSFLVREIIRSRGHSRKFYNTAFFFVLLFGPGIENRLWVVQLGYNVAIILGLGQYLLLRLNIAKYSKLAFVFGVTSILCQSISVVFLISLLFLLIAERRFLLAAFQSGLPLLLYGLWNFTYGMSAVTPGFTINPRLISNYTEAFLTELSNVTLQLPGIGFMSYFIIFTALAQLLIRPKHSHDLLYFLSAFVIYMISVTITRAGLGADQATSSRYMYVGAILLLIIGLEIFKSLPKPSGELFKGLVSLICMFAIFSNGIILYSSARDREIFNQETRRIVNEFVSRDDFALQPDDLQIDPSRNPQIRVGDLRRVYDLRP